MVRQSAILGADDIIVVSKFPSFRDSFSNTVCSLLVYSVSPTSPPPEVFRHFFANGWELLVHILHAYYTFLSTLDLHIFYSIIGYLQL